jgi:8-oxo-dGTP pyrophosphatase MutT (NUDIX family)
LEANSILDVEEGGLDYFSTAVRELFEETGVLLVNGTVNESVRSTRRDLIDSNTGWSAFLTSNELTMACDALFYFSHWITPTVLPKRWTTRFFLAELPAGQEAEPDGKEITESIWLTAEEALRHARDGRGKLPYPTRKTLESFAGLNSVQDFQTWARQQQASGISAIQPEM